MFNQKIPKRFWPLVAGALPLALMACVMPDALTPTTATYDFGEVMVGDSVQSPPIVWQNTGTITEKVVGGLALPEGGPFGVVASLPNRVLIIRPGYETPPVSFVFTPQEGGRVTGQGALRVTIPSKEPGQSAATVLSGVGRFRLAKEGITFLDAHADSDAPIDFGPVDVEGPANVKSLEIMNLSAEPIDTKVALRKGGQGFTLIGGGAVTLPPREKVTLEVQYSPDDLVSALDVVRFQALDSEETVAAIVVLGEGVAAE